MTHPRPLETAPAEVKTRLESGERLFLIDVRQPEEHVIASIAGAELIPMNTVPTVVEQLQSKADEGTLIVFCHHGVRSLNVVNWLRGQGIDACQSMSGGIDLWSVQIDPAVPRY